MRSGQITAINRLADEIHEMATVKGHWDGNKNVGEKIALMHSELSEALEGSRRGNPPDEHCPLFSSMEIEFADCVIRILDFGVEYNLDVAQAMAAKMKFNATRPYRHGKKF